MENGSVGSRGAVGSALMEGVGMPPAMPIIPPTMPICIETNVISESSFPHLVLSQERMRRLLSPSVG
jgi:hypothetical protein